MCYFDFVYIMGWFLRFCFLGLGVFIYYYYQMVDVLFLLFRMVFSNILFFDFFWCLRILGNFRNSILSEVILFFLDISYL